MDTLSVNYAEGRVFDFVDESSIKTSFLETFDYVGPRQRVNYKMKEFAAVCPFSGLPDTGIVWVEYIPRQKLLELKALKYYFLTFRNVGIFQEAVTARIFDDLFTLLNPEELMIKTRYNTRGGIDTTCTIDSNEQTS